MIIRLPRNEKLFFIFVLILGSFLLFASLSIFIWPVKVLKKQDITIIVDAGHGGKDPGSSYNGFQEKDINLEVAFYLQEILQDEGLKVVMTRTEDIMFNNNRQDDLKRRIDIANSSDAALLVSIHVNKFPSPKPFGGEVYYFTGSEQGKQLAQKIQENLLKLQKNSYRSIKEGNFYLLKKSKIPGVIVEIGFISNPKDRERLKSESSKREIARAVAQGIKDYLVLDVPVTVQDQQVSVYPEYSKIDLMGGLLPLFYICQEGSGDLKRHDIKVDYLKMLQDTPAASFVEKKIELALLVYREGDLAGIAPLPENANYDFSLRDGDLHLFFELDAKYFFSSSLMELLALQALKKTFLSLPGVNRLIIYLDERPVNTISGHLFID